MTAAALCSGLHNPYMHIYALTYVYAHAHNYLFITTICMYVCIYKYLTANTLSVHCIYSYVTVFVVVMLLHCFVCTRKSLLWRRCSFLRFRFSFLSGGCFLPHKRSCMLHHKLTCFSNQLAAYGKYILTYVSALLMHGFMYLHLCCGCFNRCATLWKY